MLNPPVLTPAGLIAGGRYVFGVLVRFGARNSGEFDSETCRREKIYRPRDSGWAVYP
jgi:hypothetical protein